jgi:hypothetical protein
LAYQRGALQRVFRFFKKKFPRTQTFREKIVLSNHITNINYLDEHAFLNIFVHKYKNGKYGIKHK